MTAMLWKKKAHCLLANTQLTWWHSSSALWWKLLSYELFSVWTFQTNKQKISVFLLPLNFWFYKCLYSIKVNFGIFQLRDLQRLKILINRSEEKNCLFVILCIHRANNTGLYNKINCLTVGTIFYDLTRCKYNFGLRFLSLWCLKVLWPRQSDRDN